MSATRTPSVRTWTVATRAAVLMVTREMERIVQVSAVCVPQSLCELSACSVKHCSLFSLQLHLTIKIFAVFAFAL